MKICFCAGSRLDRLYRLCQTLLMSGPDKMEKNGRGAGPRHWKFFVSGNIQAASAEVIL